MTLEMHFLQEFHLDELGTHGSKENLYTLEHQIVVVVCSRTLVIL